MTLFEKACLSPEHMAYMVHSTLLSIIYEIATGDADFKNVALSLSRDKEITKYKIAQNLREKTVDDSDDWGIKNKTDLKGKTI